MGGWGEGELEEGGQKLQAIIDVSWSYCGNHFIIDVNQAIMLYALNYIVMYITMS